MAYVDADGEHILARTDFTEKDMIRQVPGFTWDPEGKVWHGPLSWGSCQTLRGVFGQRLQVGPALNAWATAEHERRIAPCMALRELTSIDSQRPVQEALDRWEVLHDA